MKSADAWIENLRVLGFPENVSWERIQAKYRQLVLAYHPDLNPSKNAAERFRQIAATYEALTALRRERLEFSPVDLSQMYEDDPKVRTLSLEELGMRLHYSSSVNVRAAAACLLGLSRGKKSRQMLLQTSRETDDTVRQVVLESLGKVGQPGDLLRLLPSLKRSQKKIYFRSAGHIWARSLRSLFKALNPGG